MTELFDSRDNVESGASAGDHGATATASAPQASGAPSPGQCILHFRRVFTLLSESFIYDTLREMARRGAGTRVLTLVRFRERDRRLPVSWLLRAPDSLMTGRGPRRALEASFRISQPDVMVWPALRLLLAPYVRDIKPDSIHAHFGPDGCLIAPLAEREGVPLVVTFYGYDVSRLIHQTRRRWRPRYQRLFDQAQTIIAISNHIAERLVALGAPASKLRIIPLGVRPELFPQRDHTVAAGAASSAAEPSIVRCLHVGRLTAKKSPIQLVQAFARARAILRGGDPDLRLTIVGDGELKEATRREIRRLGMSEHIEMAGAVPHARIPDYMEQAHIYTQHCLTAPDGDMEGLGVSFMEASAAGLPVIATRHDGVPEVIADGETGLLSAEGDVEAMAANIVALARSPERRAVLGRQGRLRIEERFTLDRCVDQLMEVHGVSAARRPRRRTPPAGSAARDRPMSAAIATSAVAR